MPKTAQQRHKKFRDSHGKWSRKKTNVSEPVVMSSCLGAIEGGKQAIMKAKKISDAITEDSLNKAKERLDGKEFHDAVEASPVGQPEEATLTNSEEVNQGLKQPLEKAAKEAAEETTERCRKVVDKVVLDAVRSPKTGFVEAPHIPELVVSDPRPAKDMTAAELYAAIYDAGQSYKDTPEWVELRRRLIRWPRRRLLSSGHFIPDKRWKPNI